MTNLFVHENPTEGDRLDLGAMERCIGFKERRYIEELRILTKSTAIDCIIDDRFERIIYIIKHGEMGYTIGKGGANIEKLSRMLGKRIEMVEYNEIREVFIRNMFRPAEVSRVSIPDGAGPIHIIITSRSNLGLAIGKGGANIEKVRLLVKRFFGRDLDEIEIEGEEK